MTEEHVSFKYNGLTLAGVVRVPDGVAADERRPAFIVLHGFGSNMNAGNVLKPCAILEALGYVTLRFDMPGCGASEGEKGSLICLEQVGAVSEALSLLARHDQVDLARIGVMGSSFGAAVAVYAGGVDRRIAAVVSASGWGHGERKFRGQHPTPEAWAKFTAMLEEGRRHRERTGRSLMVPRYDIVPIPPEMRTHVVEGSIQMFPSETAQSMFDFRAEDVVGQIAPRPLLLLHSASDHVTPVEQSIGLFQHAGQPTELHLFADTDHFMFAESNTRVRRIVQDWLAEYFPVRAKLAAA
ncbi:MAG TPA: alpha/beta hydrolase [Xanthobacteraceae bacterium]|jgi:pimeloyl-ACP methyl ester carboxylesterase|nr:alpha/beta hydrolase [Xanthobacteraceae bacterium]